eukprot:CAMPEP_0115471896 /NCGR_PEP_ID=MMETSP0271-20121206/52763_1 /TAXON_ID=71861 /ORGANISM="Scrippsiella trochoidea, Strain CCMP3099" /LENGTH=76 /DNA_ID=CAMNT_0002899103 /DNA_START=225 /DNA_END=452 /DNA_ORIENTATION=-
MQVCDHVEQPKPAQHLNCKGTQAPPKAVHVLVLLTEWCAATSSPAALLSVADNLSMATTCWSKRKARAGACAAIHT